MDILKEERKGSLTTQSFHLFILHPQRWQRDILSVKSTFQIQSFFHAPKIHDWPPKDFVKCQGDYRIFAGPQDKAPGVKNKQKELQLPP